MTFRVGQLALLNCNQELLLLLTMRENFMENFASYFLTGQSR